MMRRLSVLIVSLLATLPAAAQIYQWKDAQGRTHYSDTPPPGASVKTLQPKPRAPVVANEDATRPADGQGAAAAGAEAPASEPTAAQGKAADGKTEPAKPKTYAEKDAEFRQRRAAAAEAAEKADKERQRGEELRRRCDEARGQLAGLESGQRMVRYTSSGEREVLDDAGRTAALERTRKFIADNCR